MSGKSHRIAGTLAAALLALATSASIGAYASGLNVVYAFKGGSDGAQPGVSQRDRTGDLYGATGDGGGSGCGGAGCGTIYRLTGGGAHTLLYRFAGGSDGAFPDGGVIAEESGNLYGTTYYGGGGGCAGNGCGTVFKLAPDGTETVLHAFAGGRDGALPLAPLIRVEAHFYGTTSQGGIKKCGPYNCGTVFTIDVKGNETVLHRFAGGSDGAYPGTGLIADPAGNLYGTTEVGGGSGCHASGCGTVFRLAPDGSETVLHAFAGGSDGAGPTSSLVRDFSGNLYGTTAVGGSTSCQGYGCGIVFKISTDGTEQVLYAFGGTSDGNWPWGNLVLDTNGNLFGLTDVGGSGTGVVFKLAPDGTETVLHAFAGGNDGAQPDSLFADRKGNLYGAALYGGKYGQGVVFRLKE